MWKKVKPCGPGAWKPQTLNCLPFSGWPVPSMLSIGCLGKASRSSSYPAASEALIFCTTLTRYPRLSWQVQHVVEESLDATVGHVAGALLVADQGRQSRPDQARLDDLARATARRSLRRSADGGSSGRDAR